MIIYKTTNILNGDFYVGMSKTNNKYYLGSGIYLNRAIKKYGRKNFKKEIIEMCTNIKKLEKREIYWIDKLNPNYNISKGGTGNINPSEETRRKLSMASAGKNNGMYGKNKELNPFYGKHHSIKTKNKLSKKAKERFKDITKHPTYGKKLTQSTKNKISKNHADVSGKNNPMYGTLGGMYGKKHSEETKNKLSKRMIGNKNPAKRQEIKDKISKTLKGRIPWNKGLKIKGE